MSNYRYTISITDNSDQKIEGNSGETTHEASGFLILMDRPGERAKVVDSRISLSPTEIASILLTYHKADEVIDALLKQKAHISSLVHSRKTTFRAEDFQ